MSVSTAATAFLVIFLSELPDKSLFASLVLGTRYRPLWVWLGVSAAFIVHVVIACVAGRLLTLAPERFVEIVVAVLFAFGAYLMLRPEPVEDDPEEEIREAPAARFWPVFATSFGVVVIGEWCDITQLATANMVARYDDAWSVGVGAALGLMAAAGLAVSAGARVLRYVPLPV